MLPLLSVAIALPLSANASVDINKTYVSLGSGHINCHRNINGRRVLGPFLPSTVLCSGLRHGGMREPIHLDDKQRNLNNLSTVSPTSKIATINNEARTCVYTPAKPPDASVTPTCVNIDECVLVSL